MKRAINLTVHITIAIVILLLLAMLITGCMILLRGVGSGGECTHLIILGTKVEGTEPTPMLADRIAAAAKYLQKYPDVICVVTGGKADEINISEAQCMYNGLTELGIAPERILMEDQAVSTVENFEFSLALLEDTYGSIPESLGVLSSEFHLLRAGMLAKDHGMDVITVPAATSDTKAFLTYFLREIFMVWYDGIKVAIF